MDDTLRFASRLCKFIVAASFLLVAVASLCLWWTGQAYERRWRSFRSPYPCCC